MNNYAALNVFNWGELVLNKNTTFPKAIWILTLFFLFGIWKLYLFMDLIKHMLIV